MSFISIQISSFSQSSFKLGHIFGAKSDLIKALECTGYCLNTLILEYLSALKVSFASLLKMLLGVELKMYSYVCYLC